MVTILSILWPLWQLFCQINIWLLLAPSGASRYLHMVLSSPTAVAAGLQCDLGSRCARGAAGRGQPSWRCGRGCRGHWRWWPQGLWLLQPRERNHRAAREEDKVSHAEIHRAGGSMSSAFPLRVSPYLAHTRPQWLFLISPCPHPSSSSHGMMSTQLMHYSSTRLVLQLLWQQSTMPGYF